MSSRPLVAFVVAPWFNRAMPHHGVAYLRSCLEARGSLTHYHDLSALHYRDPFLVPALRKLLSDSSPGVSIYSSLDALFDAFFGSGLEPRLGSTLHKLLGAWVDRSAEAILESSPDVVALSVYDSNIVPSLMIARDLKRRRPDLATVLGGPCLVDLNLVRILAELDDFVDYIVIGEGEIVLAELVDHLAGRSSDLPVSCVAAGTSVGISEPRFTLVDDLDSLPLPTYSGAPFAVYQDNMHAELSFMTSAATAAERVLPISFGRGCPYRCSFCGHNAWWSRYRLRSVDGVVAELESLSRSYGCRIFRVNDSLMNMSKPWLMELCEALANRDRTLYWYGHARASGLDAELARAMSRAGCRYVKFGLESGSDRVLGLMNKRSTVADHAAAVHAAHDAGLKTRASFMVNFPGETEEDLEATIAFVREHSAHLDGVRFFDTSLVPASDVAQRPEAYDVEIDWHAPEVENRAVIEAASRIPRAWRCAGLSHEEAARRLERGRDALGVLLADSSRKRLPPTFPEIVHEAAAGNPRLELDHDFEHRASASRSSDGTREAAERELETAIVAALETGPVALEDLIEQVEATAGSIRERVAHLLAWGKIRVRADQPSR